MIINLNDLADALILAAQAQARLPVLEQMADGLSNDVCNLREQIAVLQGRIDAQAAALEEARAIQAAQLKQIDALLDELAECRKPQPARSPFTVDPAFSADMLSEEQQMWRGRLLTTFGADGATYPDVNEVFSGATYTVGYQDVIKIYALVVDSTGDPAVFAEINRLMSLVDEARIVYTNDLQESYIVRLYAFYAYLLHVNGHPDAGAWRKRLLMRIAERGLVGNDDLAQCLINNMLAAWCLWLLMDAPVWREQAEALRADFMKRMVIDAERGIWKHQEQETFWFGGEWRLRSQFPSGFPSAALEPRGAQEPNYFRYDLSALLILDRLDFTVFDPELLANVVSNMYRESDDIAARMDGSDLRDPANGTLTNWEKCDPGWIISSFVMCSAYSDRVREMSIAAWERVPNHERMPFVSAAMLLMP